MKFLLKNATVYFNNNFSKKDIVIENDIITEVEDSIDATSFDNVYITDSYKDWEPKVISLNAQKKVHIIHRL